MPERKPTSGQPIEAKILHFPVPESAPPPLAPEEQKIVLRRIFEIDRLVAELEEELNMVQDVAKKPTTKERLIGVWQRLRQLLGKADTGGGAIIPSREDDLSVSSFHDQTIQMITEELTKLLEERDILISRLAPEDREQLTRDLGELRDIRRQTGRFLKPAEEAPVAVDSTGVEVSPEVLEKFGLVKKELRAFPEADQLVAEIVEKRLDPNTDEGKQRLCEAWPADCPPPFVPMEKYWSKFYPNTSYPQWFIEDRNREKEWSFWYLRELYRGNIVSNLTGEGRPLIPRFGSETVFISNRPDEDWDALDDKGNKKLQTPAYSDKLLNAVLKAARRTEHVGCVSITRETIDNLLWDGDPVNRVPSASQVAVLKKFVQSDWQNWEIRCANQREIDGQHNLWTHLDGFFLEDDGGRRGLLGGGRKYGGASYVGRNWRDDADEYYAVRLVLSRKR